MRTVEGKAKMADKSLFGVWGRLLRVDLSSGEIGVDSLDESLFKQFLGGRGLGARLLYQEVPARTDPFGQDNALIFLTGPLEGTLAPLSNKTTVTFKSPLTMTYSESCCGGHFANEIKFAGYDGILIRGQAQSPVMLWIDGDQVRIRPADHLWGKSTFETFTAIRNEAGDPFIESVVIGPAGEKLNRFGNIMSDYHRDFGRGGGGAVMGSKNLKAIAIRGNRGVEVADPEGLKAKVLALYEQFQKTDRAQVRRRYGTADMVDFINGLGFLAVHNFRDGQFDQAGNLNCSTIEKEALVAHSSCLGCPIRCGKILKQRSAPFLAIEGPEFESIALLGSNCGIGDLDALIQATEICDRYGMDTISSGNVVGFAMECLEEGILKPDDFGGLNLKFGDPESYLQAVEMVGQRRHIGDLLAEGVRLAADKLGVPEKAVHAKGMEIPAYDPRGCVGMGLTYATAARGGCHTKSPTMGAEALGDRFTTEGKAVLVRGLQWQQAIMDSLTMCMTSRFGMHLKDHLALWNLVTGYPIDEAEAEKTGLRILNMERLFNCREGLSRADDTLPHRFLKEEIRRGPSQGHVVELEPMLTEYYQLMGWDQEGRPTEETLSSLGLDTL